jgi:glutathione S-transferase
MGERYTICDPYLFTLAAWLDGDGVDLTKLPRVIDHRTGCTSAPGCQASDRSGAGLSCESSGQNT